MTPATLCLSILLVGNFSVQAQTGDDAKRLIAEFEHRLLSMPREKMEEREPLVVEFFKNLKEPDAKVIAIGLIDERNVQVIPPKMESALLGKFLEDNNLTVRARAAVALAFIGKGSEHFDELKKLLGESNSGAKQAALAAMGNSKELRFLPLVKPYLKNDDPQLRRSAVWALSHFNPDLVRADLIPLLNDPAVEVRAGCTRDIARVGGKEVLPQVAKLVYDDHAAVRLNAIVALADQNDVRWAKFVAHLLKDENPQVRGQAAKTLAKLKAFDYSGAVLALLGDKDNTVRCQAAQAVQQYGDKAFAPKLTALLEDKDEQVRQLAIQGLWVLGAKNSANAIAARLTDPGAGVRREAVLALLKMECTGHAAQIAQVLEDKDCKVRLYAVTALGIFRAEAYLPRIKLLCEDEDSVVRDAARFAVSRIEQR